MAGAGRLAWPGTRYYMLGGSTKMLLGGLVALRPRASSSPQAWAAIRHGTARERCNARRKGRRSSFWDGGLDRSPKLRPAGYRCKSRRTYPEELKTTWLVPCRVINSLTAARFLSNVFTETFASKNLWGALRIERNTKYLSGRPANWSSNFPGSCRSRPKIDTPNSCDKVARLRSYENTSRPRTRSLLNAVMGTPTGLVRNSMARGTLSPDRSAKSTVIYCAPASAFSR